MDRFSRFGARLGGKLGTVVCLLGALLLYLGWNGAASHNDIRKQFPYIVSGGLAGLALVVLGAALLVIEAMRGERTALQSSIVELKAALDALAPRHRPPADAVVAGASSYHRPTCRLIEGRDELEVVAPSDAEARGLAPCRICHPDVSPNGNGSRSLSSPKPRR
jgi:HAMP domain-containing protein